MRRRVVSTCLACVGFVSMLAGLDRAIAKGLFKSSLLPNSTGSARADGPRLPEAFTRGRLPQLNLAGGQLPGDSFVFVRGTVVGPDDQPKPRVRVGLLLSPSLREVLQQRRLPPPLTESDGEGMFELRLPALRETLRIVARSMSDEGLVGSVLLPSMRATDVRIRLSPGRILRGRVADGQRGGAVGSASLFVQSETDTTLLPATRPGAVSDSDGLFVLAGVAEQDEVVAVRHSRYLGALVRLTAPIPPSLDVRLTPARVVSRTVTDSSGNAIPGARIVATAGPEIRIEVIAGPSGEFVVAPLAEGASLVLNVSAVGFSEVRNLVSAPDTSAVVVLQRYGVLAGHVVDADTGVAVSLFSMEVFPRAATPFRSSLPPSRSFEASDGQFEWSGLPAGEWTIRVRARGYQPLEIPRVQVATGATSQLDVSLRLGVSIAGRVFDRASGLGVGGLQVAHRETRALLPGNPTGLYAPSAITDTDGLFQLEGMPQGRVTLHIERSDKFAPAIRDIDVRAGATFVEIPVFAGASITGKVVDGDRQSPVSGAIVELWDLAMGSANAFPIAASGDFSIPHLAPGRYRVSAESAVGRTDDVEVVLGTDEQQASVVLVTRNGVTIRGQVSGLMRGELGRVNIEARGDSNFFARTAVDRNGTYTLAGVVGLHIELEAETALGRGLVKYLEVGQGHREATVDFLFPAGVRLSGRVTRAGRPVPFIVVTAVPDNPELSSGSGESFQAGQYAIDGLAPGDYTLLIKNGMAQRVSVSGDTHLDIELPTGTVVGRVVDSRSNGAVAAAFVTLARAGEPVEGLTSVSISTDREGAFRTVGLVPGPYEAIVTKAGYALGVQEIDVSEGVSETTVELVASGGVRIRVVDAESNVPLPNAFVDVASMNGARARVSLVLDANGIGEVPRLGVGARALVSAAGYAPSILDSGASVSGMPVPVFLRRGGRIQVRVEATMVRAELTLTSERQAILPRALSLPYNALLEDLPEGAYHLRVRRGDQRASYEVTVRRGQVTEVEVRSIDLR